MEFQKIETSSLKDLFVNQLENAILSGDIKVGTKLPGERELCSQFGISRSVVNSGLNEMAKKGFLDIEPRKGVYVADYRKFGTSDILISIMNYHNGKLPNKDLKSLLEIKEIIDIYILPDVIENINDDTIKELNKYIDMIQGCKTPEDGANARYLFSLTLAGLSDNTFITLLYNSIKPAAISTWKAYIEKYGGNAMCDYPLKLMQLILNKDTNGAVEYTRFNFENTIRGSRQLYT